MYNYNCCLPSAVSITYNQMKIFFFSSEVTLQNVLHLVVLSLDGIQKSSSLKKCVYGSVIAVFI